ncbi:hypothetical protein PC116_g16774 [Phytophthora cactorum]|nr:hypothetical protein PC116_g16774 [Phytophthora cactorum]
MNPNVQASKWAVSFERDYCEAYNNNSATSSRMPAEKDGRFGVWTAS